MQDSMQSTKYWSTYGATLKTGHTSHSKESHWDRHCHDFRDYGNRLPWAKHPVGLSQRNTELLPGLLQKHLPDALHPHHDCKPHSVWHIALFCASRSCRAAFQHNSDFLKAQPKLKQHRSTHVAPAFTLLADWSQPRRPDGSRLIGLVLSE